MTCLKTMTPAVLSCLLVFMASGCGSSGDTSEDVSATTTVEFRESEPVAGWLEVVLPGVPVALDAGEGEVWILTDTGMAMGWNSGEERWSSVEAEFGKDIAVLQHGLAILTPGGISVLSEDEMTEYRFDDSDEPIAVTDTDMGPVVLFADGSLTLCSTEGPAVILEPSGRDAQGSLVFGDGTVAWMNTDGSASQMEMETGLLREIILPENTAVIDIQQGMLLASDGETTRSMEGDGTWSEYCSGIPAGGGFLCTQGGIAMMSTGETVAPGTTFRTERVADGGNGMFWAMGENTVAVWAEIGSVETRLPEADVQRITFRIAGQTGSGSGNGDGVGSAGASLGGVFRIYESVSSRPDPFTEFPATSRDLRRSIEDLTIEELHLVGITIDPSGGDQAMVEDANGVAYVLREGTMLRNNTRIAEITGNEVIVVQEVTVGSEDDLGGTTSIPTIFSMRLHEEGGL